MEPKFEVPISAFEDAIQMPLEVSSIERIDFDYEIVERLYFSLKKYHAENRIEPKIGIIRPNINFVSWNDGVFCTRDFDIYKENQYIPRNGDFEVRMDWIKKTLLFSHEVVIEDPVFSFCRGLLVAPFQEAKPNYELLSKALKNIAELKPLLESRSLRITAFFPQTVDNIREQIKRGDDDSYRVPDILAATDFTKKNINRHVTYALEIYNKSDTNINFSNEFVANQVINHDDYKWLYKQAESLEFCHDDKAPYCPFLYDKYQLKLYQKLMNVLSNPSISANKASLVNLTTLSSNYTIDTSNIKITDLDNIRRSEKVFEEWRKLLSDTIDASVIKAKSGFSELELFRDEILEKEKWWNSNFANFKPNEGFLKGILRESKLTIGGLGLVGGALLSGGALIPALMGGLGTEAVHIMYRCLNQFDRYDAEKAATSFFMALR